MGSCDPQFFLAVALFLGICHCLGKNILDGALAKSVTMRVDMRRKVLRFGCKLETTLRSVCRPTELTFAPERHGMQKVFETARMYTGQPPAVPIGCIFGVTSFELG